jgi:hypothetical protein
LREACEAKIRAASVFEYDEELDDKSYGLDLEVCKTWVLASDLQVATKQMQHYIAIRAQLPAALPRIADL